MVNTDNANGSASTESSPYDIPASAKEFRENLAFFGSKITTLLTGAENFPQWESQLKRKARGLAALGVLEGHTEGLSKRLYKSSFWRH